MPAVSLREYNLLGSGITAGIRTPRTSTVPGPRWASPNHLFGNRTGIAYTYGVLDVGKVQTFSFGRPFYALDTPWAYASRHRMSISTVYDGGRRLAVPLECRQRRGHGGWSTGRVEGWVQRFSIGFASVQHLRGAADQPPRRNCPRT